MCFRDVYKAMGLNQIRLGECRENICRKHQGGHRKYDLKELLGSFWNNAVHTAEMFNTTLPVFALIEFLEIKCKINNFRNVMCKKGTKEFTCYHCCE